ncbi:DUF5060 domain-containing protein [Candidatus Neomarinimicrobiota bacterium]
MKVGRRLWPLIFLLGWSCTNRSPVIISGDPRVWSPLTLSIKGPYASEMGDPNPFLDYRLEIVFTNDSLEYTVPGYFAADGNAANTGADSGSIWRVHFTPDQDGVWSYKIAFRQGPLVALSSAPDAGSPVGSDGLTGSFAVQSATRSGRNLESRGRLGYTESRYLRFSGTGDYFLEAGISIPLNFLAYTGFDGTYDVSETDSGSGQSVHTYAPHIRDWESGDPTWQAEKGRGIIGVLNYLASSGVNSLQLTTHNLDDNGAGSVWPWGSPSERLRYDVSKLGQWEITFAHMERLGMILRLSPLIAGLNPSTDFDEQVIGPKLYGRELVARFSHYQALVWDFTDEDAGDTGLAVFISWLESLDPYHHPVLLGSAARDNDTLLVLFDGLTGSRNMYLQLDETDTGAHLETLSWASRSDGTGLPWVITAGDNQPRLGTLMSDMDDVDLAQARINVLWGNLMAGGSGVEWRASPGNMRAENFRVFEPLFNQTRYAVEFFRRYLPFWEMQPADDLVTRGWCLAKPGEFYAVYLPEGGRGSLSILDGVYNVYWYNPRDGRFETGSAPRVTGPGTVNLGRAPFQDTQDWVALLTRAGTDNGSSRPNVLNRSGS